MAVKTKIAAPAKGTSRTKRHRTADKAKAPSKVAGKPDVRIFISYSHQDAAAQAKLAIHLAPWERDGVTLWYDENLQPGAALDTEIAGQIRNAHVFVALFSPAYLASHYCWDIEYKRAMGRRARKLMRVVGVVVKPCAWKQTPAAGFKLLPKDGVPPERWSSSDAAFVNVAQGIGEVVKAVRRELALKAAKPERAASKPAVPPAAGSPPPKAKVKALIRRKVDPNRSLSSGARSRTRKAPPKA